MASAEVAVGAAHVASAVALFNDDGAAAAISCVSRATTISVAPREPVMIGFGGAREPLDHAQARVFIDEDGSPLFAILRALAGSTAMGNAVVSSFPSLPAFDEARGPDALSVIFTLFVNAADLAVRGEGGALTWKTRRRCIIAESAHDAELWVRTGNEERQHLAVSTSIDALPGDPCPRCRTPLFDAGAETLKHWINDKNKSLDDLGIWRTPIPLGCDACLMVWRSNAVRIDDFRRGDRHYEKS